MRANILALCGDAGCGKDYAASVINHKFSSHRVAFADEVYNSAAILFGTTVESLGRRLTKNTPMYTYITYSNSIKFIDYIHKITGVPRHIAADGLAQWIEKDLKKFLSTFETPVNDKILAHLYISPRNILRYVGTDYGRQYLYPEVWVDIVRNKIAQTKGNIVITDVRFPDEVALVRELNGSIIKIYTDTTKYSSEKSHISDKEVTDFDASIFNNFTPSFKKALEIIARQVLLENVTRNFNVRSNRTTSTKPFICYR